MTHGEFEVVSYKDGKRSESCLGILHQAQELARSMLASGYYPVVVYDKIKQRWVDIDE